MANIPTTIAATVINIGFMMEMVSVTDSPATTPIAVMMPVAEVHVGARHRKHLGDTAGLAANIGLLHPVRRPARRDGVRQCAATMIATGALMEPVS